VWQRAKYSVDAEKYWRTVRTLIGHRSNIAHNFQSRHSHRRRRRWLRTCTRRIHKLGDDTHTVGARVQTGTQRVSRQRGVL
ncbi:MAG: hypothetical protein ACK4F6_19395, partial [Hylemonella sp.]